jgi:hypothetical protein
MRLQVVNLAGDLGYGNASKVLAGKLEADLQELVLKERADDTVVEASTVILVLVVLIEEHAQWIHLLFRCLLNKHVEEGVERQESAPPTLAVAEGFEREFSPSELSSHSS